MPLPESWLAFLSPQRFIWLQKANDISGLSGWTSISYTPLETFYKGIWLVFLALFAVVFRQTLAGTRDSEWLFKVLFVLCGFEAFFGLLQVLIPSLGVPGAGEVAHRYAGYARGTFNNRNHFASFLNMTWPLLLAYILGLRIRDYGLSNRAQRSKLKAESKGLEDYRFARIRGLRTKQVRRDAEGEKLSYPEREWVAQVRQKQIFFGFVLGLILLALFFSASRGGILSALVAMTVFMLLEGKNRKPLLFLIFICWSIVLVYGSIIGFDQIIARFDMLGTDAPGRFQIWETGWRIVKDHVWTGTGLGSFGDLFRVYQDYLDDIRTTNYRPQ